MRMKIIGIMLSITLIMSTLSGCGEKMSFSSDATAAAKSLGEFQEESDLEENGGSADNEENYALETAGEAEFENLEIEVNALGMPLKDDTTLVVTQTVYVHNHTLTDRVKKEYEYDREGRILRYIDYDPYGTLGGRWEYEYDAAGNLTKETCYGLEDGGVTYWIEYRDANDDSEDEGLRIGSKYEGEGNLVSEIVYNSGGDLIKRIYYREDGTVSKVYEYDGAGNELRAIECDEQGNLLYRRELEYDAAGNMTLMADYDADGNIVVSESYDCDTYQIIQHYWPTENEYDAAGNLIRKVNYEYDYNILNVSEYTYDDAGNLIRYVEDDLEYNATSVTEYEYDNAGNRIKEIYNTGNHWKEYEYDSENRIIKMTEYTSGTAYTGYEYEYRIIGAEE